MASNNNRVNIQITVDGKQAEATLNVLQREVDTLKKNIEDMQKGTVPFDESKYKAMQQELKQLNLVLGATERDTQLVEKVMNDLSGATLRKLQTALREVRREMLSASEDNRQMETLSKQYEAINAQIQKLKGSLDQMSVSRARATAAIPKDFSTAELEKALSVLQNYKKQLKISDVEGLTRVNTEIENINMALGRGTMSAERFAAVISNPQNFSPQEIRAAIAIANKELDKMTMNDPARNGLINQIEQLNGVLKETKSESVNVQEVLSHLPNASMKELTQAAKQLRSEMDELDTTTDKYAQKKTEYIQIQKQIEGINHSFSQQDSTLEKVMKRLAAYVSIYGVFNFATGKMHEWIDGNIELSDSLADIQKTTGLTEKQVAELSREIDGIDTRTGQEELHKLAYEAGKLGISAKNDVMEFVEAGNQVRVALGEDLGEDAIKNLMKLNEVMGNTQKMGIEKALLATGSAINEVGQSSTASEGYMVDFAQRLGGIAAQSHLTMAELIALGGTTDALGQNVEVSATALNKFIVAVQTNTRAVAQAAGINDEYLKSLLDSGQTMQAMVEVLSGLSQKGGLSQLAPLMGDLGSDGARLTAVLTSMASNVDLLKAQLYTANQGFDQAISVTQEYNIKNENAAAIIARIGNNIKEYFINSGMVGWLKSVLVYIYDLPNALERNIVLLGVLKGILASIVTLLTIKGLQATATFLKTIMVDAITMVTGSLSVLQRAISINTIGVSGLRKAWIALNLAMKSNFFGVILAAVTAAGFAIYEFATHTSKAEQAMKDANIRLQEENYQLTSLKTKIDKANTATGERQSLISQFNNKYSTYLGYMLSESANAEQIAKAYKLVNAELERKAMLEAKEDAQKSVRDKYSGVKVSAIEDLRSQLESNYGVTGDMQADMIGYIQELVQETDLSAEQIIKNLENKYKQKRGFGKKIWDAMFQTDAQFGVTTNDLYPIIQRYKNTLQSESKELENVSLTFDGEIKRWSKKSIDERQVILNEWSESLFTPKALKNVEQSKKDIDTYIQVNNQQLDALQQAGKDKTEQFNVVKRNIDFARSKLNKLSSTTTTPSYWGEGLDIETAGVEKLAAKWKELWKVYTTINGDKNYTSSVFKSREEEMKALSAEMDKYEAKLNSLGANKYGKPLGGGSTENKLLKRTKEEIKGALAAIDTYFIEEQQKINQGYLDLQSIDNDKNSQLLANERAHLLARTELRKSFLGIQNEFSGESYGIEQSTLAHISTLLKQYPALQEEINKKLAEDQNKELELRIKHRQEVEKILRQTNVTTVVRDDYMARLKEVGVFNAGWETLDKEASNARMDILTKFSKESYNLNWLSLSKLMQSEDTFKDWSIDMTQDKYKVLLALLQEYLDATEDAQTKDVERKKRIAARVWEQSDEKKGYDNQLGIIDQNKPITDFMQKNEFVSDTDAADYELQRINILMEAKEKEIEIYRARNADVSELETQMNELQQQALQQHLNIWQAKYDTMKGYTDALVTFSKDMGAAAFGEVKDRKAAAKQLLQTVGNLTIQLIANWAKQKAMKLLFGQQEIAAEQTIANTSQAIKAGQTVSEATQDAAGASASVAAGIASGTAKEVGSKGLIGLAIGAVIAAALGAVLSLALSKIETAVPGSTASASSSNKKKLASGMLTYAEGRYPVLGNDGQSYNAKYTPQLRTGVYNDGPHFGIFSEKGTEMVIDAPTYKNMMLNAPGIYDSIMYLRDHGRLPTYADGRYPENEVQIPLQQVNTEDVAAIVMQNMAPMLEANVNVINRLANTLEKGIGVLPFGKNSLDEGMRNISSFNKRNGLR